MSPGPGGSSLGEVWDHYQILNTNNFKRHVVCMYCNKKEFKYGSAPRLKKHLQQCERSPDDIKKKFKPYPATQKTIHHGHSVKKIWDHFEFSRHSNLKRSATCNYCGKKFQCGTPQRMISHIVFKCNQCPHGIKEKFAWPSLKEEAIEESELTQNWISDPTSDDNYGDIDDAESNHAETNDIGTNDVETNDTGTNDLGTDKIFTSTLANLSNKDKCDPLKVVNIDEKLVRAMYYSGVDLALLESRYWKQALNAANVHIPSQHSIRNTLLQAEFKRVLVGINNLLHNSQALALIVDGWTDINQKSVVNFILATPLPIFVKSVRLATEKPGEYLGLEIIKVIEEIGSAKVVAVITDNAAYIKDAWQIVNNKHPHISCVRSVHHTLNLLLADIMKIRTCKQIHDKCVGIIEHILYNEIILAKFEDIQTKEYGAIKCRLKLPSKMNWSVEVQCLDSLRLNREALQTLASSNVLDIEIQKFVKDSSFWIILDDIISVIQPISDALKSGSNLATLSDVPATFSNLEKSTDSAIQSVSFLSTEEKNKIKQAVINRKGFCIEPIHLAANYLDPRYRGEHLGSSLPAAVEFIEEYASHIYNGEEEKIAEVMENVLQFKVKSGYYGKTKSIWRVFRSTTPSEWWQAFAPEEILAPIAIRLLSVPPSSAVPGINWSLLGNTHADKTYNLNKEQLEKLMYIRVNLRLMDESKVKELVEGADEIMSNHESYVEDSKNYALTNEDIDNLNNL